MNIFERYGGLAGSESRFRVASTSRLPLTAWANPPLWLRVRDLLGDTDDVLEPLPGRQGVFRIADPSHPSFVAARLLGALHIQEEAAMLPIDMLQPSGGQRILDACAAPGNKTAAIAVRLGTNGRVVAVDANESRMGVLRTTLNTLGIVNAAGVRADAASLYDGLGSFDAAMVDVPCSCEGTSRKYPDVIRCMSEDARGSLVDLQTRILRRAIRLVRPGGRIVYATCTYAPEENEGVVSAVLEHPDVGDEVRVIPCPDYGLAASPGVSGWRGRSYPAGLRHAKRLWPHRSDTGGFFAVLLEKTGTGRVSAGPRSTSADTSPSGGAAGNAFRSVRAEDYPWSAYGIDPTDFKDLVDMRTGSKYSSLVSAALSTDPVMLLPSRPGREDAAAAMLFAGMRGMNLKSDIVRPSTAAAIRFGGGASMGTIEIAPEDVRAYMRRAAVPVGRFMKPCEPIPVAIVRSGACALGLGRIDASDPGSVRSLFPKIRAGIEVAETLAF